MALQVLMNALVVQAESAAHLSRIHSGGIPGLPVITGITPVTNGVTITWDGPGGNYRLYQKATVTDTQWQPVGDPINLLRSATVTAPSSAGIFKISGPPPRYVGVQACLECHSPVANTVTHTRHFNAFSSPSFAALGGQTDAACLACHTVGFGVPTGFLFNSRTPHLANVQCENCHGPAGLHAANPEDPVTRPRVEIASTMCGGCHNASVPARVAALHPARFEEWSTSGHHEIVPEVKSIFEDPGVNPSTIARCGACHSGSVREALLEGTAPPAGHEAAAIGIACATCHDSHEVSVHTNVLNGVQRNPLTGFVLTNRSLGATYTNQISSPLASLADYHTTGNFATNYNPDINICAQCHNDRGASAKGLDRAPHHSGQYNMLLGSFSEEDTTIPARQPATHALLEKQCVSCHMQTANGTSGHTFAVKSFGLCAECHAQPEALVQFTKTAVMYQIQRDKSALDFWATNKAPPALRKYGARAWEYVNPGSLSGAGPSPTLAEQSAIPPSIQKARFMVYMVLNEGSFGVHNGPYTTDLLTAAYNLVVEELGK